MKQEFGKAVAGLNYGALERNPKFAIGAPGEGSGGKVYLYDGNSHFIMLNKRKTTIVAIMERLIQAAKTTLVMVTHDMQLAEQAHRIVRLADGRIVDDRPGGGAPAVAGTTT